jgi:hypothetical protein
VRVFLMETVEGTGKLVNGVLERMFQTLVMPD